MVPAVVKEQTDAQYYAEHEISVKGGPVQRFTNFADTPYPDNLKKALTGMGFKSPSTIQVRLRTPGARPPARWLGVERPGIG